MKKTLAMVLALVLCMASVCVAMAEAEPVKTGLYVEISVDGSTDGNAKSYNFLYAVTVDDNGVIDACVIDAIQTSVAFDETGKITTDLTTEFPSKNALGDAYGMRKASSISAEWNEQAAAFASYCVGKTAEEVLGIPSDENGKAVDADLLSGATLSIVRWQYGVAAAADAAEHKGASKGDKLFLPSVTVVSSSKDATAEANGNAQAYASYAAITVNGDVVTSCVLDSFQANVAFDATGKLASDINAPVLTKTQLGDAYGMRVASAIGKEWNEQAAFLSEYVTGKTLSEIVSMPLTEKGNPVDADVASGCSMKIGGYVKLFAMIAE